MTGHHTTLTKYLGPAALAVGLAMVPLAANAGDAAQEITTAATHAGFAAKSGTIQMVHAHMHHALNCLVGPNGNGFDTGALDPCKNQGSGAIVDETDAAKKASLEQIAASLRGGVADNTLASAQKTAGAAEAALIKLK